MRRLFFLLMLVMVSQTLFPVIAVAQISEDVMQVQRCVWACQRNTKSQAAYGQCVTDQCNFEAEETDSPDGWQDGTIQKGQTSYAGVDNADGSLGLYYFCDANGRSEIMLAGISDDDSYWVLSIGPDDLPFGFVKGSNGLYATAMPSHGLFAYLRAGRSVTISRADGAGDATGLTLSGSRQALDNAMARCR